jgi:hypothetical protein
MVAIGQLDFELHEAQRETGPVDVLAQVKKLFLLFIYITFWLV